MSVSRRRFLTAGAIMSAALVLKPSSFVFGRNSLWSNNSTNPDHSYRREMFEPYVGDIFRVHVGKQTIDLKLVALDTISPASRGITTGKTSRTDCFSMQFHAIRPLPATARIHNLNHGKLGSFDLFMTQAKKGSKFLQTAIINHVD
jgi:uncharacterized protein DUF6916